MTSSSKIIGASLFSFFFYAINADAQTPKIKSAKGASSLESFTKVVEPKDPTFASLINENATLEKIATGFGFTEGVIWRNNPKGGELLFSDMAANVIYSRSADGKISTYLEKSGYPYHDIWRVGMRFHNGKNPDDPAYEAYNLIGSNGMTLDPQGRLLIATWTGRSIDRIAKNGQRTKLATNYQGKRFGGPNDLVVLKNGSIYFTDTFGSMLHPEKDENNEQKINAVYLLKPNGTIVRVIDDIPLTNGLAVSPDEKYLYVNGSRGKFIKKYEIQADGTVTNGTMLIDLSKEPGAGITDGMKVDVLGNLWSTGPGGIWILSPAAKLLGFIRIPDPCTNLVFGGNDKKTLYISTPSSIYKIKTTVAGL